MKIFEYQENTYDMDTRQRRKVADWTVVQGGLHTIIVEKITPQYHRGDIIKKVIKVENCDDFVVKLLKTKIKAIGGAEGLIDWMQRCKDENIMTSMVERVLNFAWDEMKYSYL